MMRTSTGSISVRKIIQKKEIAQRKAEIHDGEGGQQRDGDLAQRDRQRHHQAVEHHASDRCGGTVGRALRQDRCVVFQQVAARQQRHRRRQHLLGRQRRGDEGHPDGKGHHRDAAEQRRVAEQVEPGAPFDHQYCTRRST